MPITLHSEPPCISDFHLIVLNYRGTIWLHLSRFVYIHHFRNDPSSNNFWTMRQQQQQSCTNSPPTEESSRQLLEILFWPKDKHDIHQHQQVAPTKSNLGFVIGWNDKALSQTCVYTTRNSIERTIVVGIIPIHDIQHVDDERDIKLFLQRNERTIQRSYHKIHSRIKSMQQNRVFDDITILGLFIQSTVQDTNLFSSILHQIEPNLYKRIFYTSTQGLPTIHYCYTSDTIPHTIISKQVIFYNPNYTSISTSCYDHIFDVEILWNHTDMYTKQTNATMRSDLTNSAIKQSWLKRLTHAGLVLCMISQDQVPKISKATQHTKTATNNTKLLTPNNTNPFCLRHRIMKLLYNQSLFIRHCNLAFSVKDGKQNNIINNTFPVMYIIHYMISPIEQPTNSLIYDDSLLYEDIHQYIQQYQEFVLKCIDAIVGILFGTILLYYCTSSLLYKTTQEDDSIVIITKSVLKIHYQQLHNYIQYLEEFPFGFKLNQDLLYNIGREIQRFWKVHEWIIFISMNEYNQLLFHIPIIITSFISILCGGSGCTALLFDIIHFSTLHISIIAWFTIRIYSYELYLLSALWKLFRGKKHNILRHRTDTMDYDSMQLLIGTIFFAIVLFLFTTILVGHVFYSILYYITILMTIPTIVLYVILQSFPWGVLWLRLRRPGWFTREIYLIDDGANFVITKSSIPIDITTLHFRPHTFQTLIKDTTLNRLKSPIYWVIKSIIRSILGQTSSWKDFLDTITVNNIK